MIKKNMNKSRLTNTGNPTNYLDAVTKLYVDSITNSITTHPDLLRKDLEYTFASLMFLIIIMN